MRAADVELRVHVDASDVIADGDLPGGLVATEETGLNRVLEALLDASVQRVADETACVFGSLVVGSECGVEERLVEAGVLGGGVEEEGVQISAGAAAAGTSVGDGSVGVQEVLGHALDEVDWDAAVEREREGDVAEVALQTLRRKGRRRLREEFLLHFHSIHLCQPHPLQLLLLTSNFDTTHGIPLLCV